MVKAGEGRRLNDKGKEMTLRAGALEARNITSNARYAHGYKAAIAAGPLIPINQRCLHDRKKK
jgi:hypothetical protein